jgi:hypothetical protein
MRPWRRDVVKKKYVEAGYLLLDLRHGDPIDKMTAAWAIGEIGNPKSIPHLIEAIEDPDEDVRIAVWNALKKITGQEIGLDKEAWLKWYYHSYIEENR